MKKISFIVLTMVLFAISNSVFAQSSVVVLNGNLAVYPEDLGYFTEYPKNQIETINQNATYGYDGWRLPTVEELQLIQKNKDQISNLFGAHYAHNDTKSIFHLGFNVRLVTTSKSIAARDSEAAEKKRLEDEQKRLIEEERKTHIVINGVRWAAHNESGYYEVRARHCPKGYRLPTKKEMESLVKVSNYWTTEDGVTGRMFVSGDVRLFLPAAGYQESAPYRHTIEMGVIGRYLTNETWGSAVYTLQFDKNKAEVWQSSTASGTTSNVCLYSVRCVCSE